MQRVLLDTVRSVFVRRDIELDVALRHVILAVAETREVVRKPPYFRARAVGAEGVIGFDDDLAAVWLLKYRHGGFEVEIVLIFTLEFPKMVTKELFYNE